jgi:hypothetical protein
MRFGSFAIRRNVGVHFVIILHVPENYKHLPWITAFYTAVDEHRLCVGHLCTTQERFWCSVQNTASTSVRNDPQESRT